MPFAWILGTILLLFAVSQVYWFGRARVLFRGWIPHKTTRRVMELVCLAALLVFFALNFGAFGRRPTSIRLTAYDALVEAPFEWWLASSVVAFLLVILLWPVRRASRAITSPGRRQFLERTTTAIVAAPFVAGAYGLFYGRLNLQTPTQRIRLPHLPKAFAGFRIAQLSDIHIGPFMTEAEIRKYVGIANALKPDLVALTGDFVTWDPSTQRAVVGALAGLKAPFGIFGCLGNHEAWSGTEDSITLLFAQAGIRILRQARVPISTAGESLNLMGVDYSTRRHTPTPGNERFVRRYLEGVESLVAPDTVNILMSHNPDTFDRAAELGIDLSLAGHTHGGQVALEFVSPEIAPSRLVTPYVAGWFEKPGGQLYVNRGIGTIGVPMRIGAPPEITVYELIGAPADAR
jgi:predicted MPP superfamily phosphohydrolase